MKKNLMAPQTGTWISIRPASFDVPQRKEALAEATKLGQGLRMEIHGFSTQFYADPDVEVGKIAVYAPPSWERRWPEYVTTLDNPEDDWRADASNT